MKAILVNVFGGIVSCATIAEGIIEACKDIELKIPLVVRLEGKLCYTLDINRNSLYMYVGTNVEQARELLEKSGLPILRATDLTDAASKAVECLKS